jgi:hypothetical protein
MSDKKDTYYTLLEQWLKYHGFEPVTIDPNAGFDKVFKRSRIKASKFGKVDTYCSVRYMPEGATGEELKIFSEKTYELCMRHRTGAPLGFGAMMVVYPLIIIENISKELASFIKTYCPKHFASAEFPSVLDLSTNYLYYYEETPFWGYAYYSGYRKEVYAIYSPRGWQEITKKNS